MGSSESKPKTQKKEHKNLYKLMKAHYDYNTDTNTINFSRKDLANTISDNSIIDLIQAGGDKLKNIPSRDRYSKYETQQIKNKNQNLVGGDYKNQFSSVSEEEMKGLKHLVMHGAGCGCGENKVLNLEGGKSKTSSDSSYNPLNSMTMSDSSKKSKSSNSSSYNPMNSITPTGLIGSGDERITMTDDNNRNMIGGNCSATSSYMPSQVNSASATSSYGGSVRKNESATSSYMPSQVNYASATSSYGGSVRKNESATSSYMPSQVNSASATSLSNKSESDENNLNSNDNRLLNLLKSEQKGGNLSSSSSISTISKSESAINYHNLIGGQQDDDENSDLDESPSTTTTESTTTENTKNSDNTESTVKDKQSRLDRLSTASKTKSSSKTRSSKASSTSSSASSSSLTTSTGSSTFDSSSSQHSSDTSSSSRSSTTDNSRMSKNIYLSTTMSDGNVIDAKQFYSSDMGELYSSDTNFLRHNLTKRRFR